MSGLSMRRALKLATLFGVTQGVLLAGGAGLATALHWLLEGVGHRAGPLHRVICGLDSVCISSVFHMVLSLCGAAILCAIGINLVRNYIMYGDKKGFVYYSGRAALMLLTLSVSMDALSAGVGLGMLEGMALTRTSLVVTLVISAMALGGLRSGRTIGRLIGRKAEPVGGCVLILLSIHFILQAF